MSKRIILHVDCNKFYASVECYLHPELRDKPVAIGGSAEMRHGIILTKNEIASKYGLCVGEPLWQARQKCPELVIIPPNFKTYKEFSKRVRKILEDYSDYIEPFGLDESWVDVSGDKRGGEEIANEIRKRIKKEIGITVSVGVSFNKVFAKLGSDYKKPDATTIISEENFKDIVWRLPCEDLLFVGAKTKKKLNYYGIYTIGDLARNEKSFLLSVFGKNGILLYNYANGLDTSKVLHKDTKVPPKSIGNSTTTPRDICTNDEAKIILTVLSESVARRMREEGFKCSTILLTVRSKSLTTFTRQERLTSPTNVSTEIRDMAMALLIANYEWKEPIRSVGVTATDFNCNECEQYDFDGTTEKREKLERLEKAVDKLKNRYGNFCVVRGSLMTDNTLSRFNPHDDHTVSALTRQSVFANTRQS